MSSVHSTHCCKKHGCKYADDDCPVVLGTEPQEYRQECCDWADNYLIDAYRAVLKDMKERNIKGMSIKEVKEKASQKKKGWH